VLLGLGAGEKATANLSVQELLKTINAQVVGGGQASTQGRSEQDVLLGQTLYLVPGESQRPRLVSQSLIQDVMVLQIGNFPKSDQTKVSTPQPTPGAPTEPTPTPAPGATPVPQQQQPDVITLVVSPQDAVTLNYLIYSGAELTLALRSAKDDTRVQTEAVTLQFLLEQYNIPVPARLPYSMEPRIDAIVAPVLTNDIKPTPQK
jgi:pilus assembly protein CpaB